MKEKKKFSLYKVFVYVSSNRVSNHYYRTNRVGLHGQCKESV